MQMLCGSQGAFVQANSLKCLNDLIDHAETLNSEPPLKSRLSAKDQYGSDQQLFQIPQTPVVALTQAPANVMMPRSSMPMRFNLEQFRRNKHEANGGLSAAHKKKLKALKMSKTSQCCSICQQAFEKDEIITQLPCKHIFHRKECISQWLKCSVQCPLCKMDLEEHFRAESRKQLEAEL